MNWSLLVVFLLILGAIVTSNLWLKRTAEASNERSAAEDGGSDPGEPPGRA